MSIDALASMAKLALVTKWIEQALARASSSPFGDELAMAIQHRRCWCPWQSRCGGNSIINAECGRLTVGWVPNPKRVERCPATAKPPRHGKHVVKPPTPKVLTVLQGNNTIGVECGAVQQHQRCWVCSKATTPKVLTLQHDNNTKCWVWGRVTTPLVLTLWQGNNTPCWLVFKAD